MTKKVDTWMPLLVDKYLGDTSHLTAEQHGAYLLLLMAMWKKDGQLPNDEERLANTARLSPARWKANRGVLLEFFTNDGSAITQKRLTVELANSKKLAQAKADAGAKGAAKRWQKDGEGNGTAIAEPSASQSQTGTSISIPSASQSISEANASAAAAALSSRDRIWAMGLALVGEKGRAFIGKAVASYGEERLLEVLAEATADPPVDPKAWIVAACEARGKPKANGKHAESALELLAQDPRPAWVVSAGFADIFAAQSAGCGPGNSAKFREGRRVEA